MKKGYGLLGGALLSSLTALAWAEVPMRAVALFASGVGYFQHAGTVAAPGEVRLSFKDEQLDDLLKSLVVDDVDGGAALQAIYPSREPLERLLAGLQVDLSDNPGVGELLSRLRGAKVLLNYHGEQLAGRLLGAEQRPLSWEGKGEGTSSDWVVNLASEEGSVRSLPWRDLRGMQIVEERVRQDLARSLALLDGNRGRERRDVVIPIPGQGSRRIRLGYVMESPVWKSAWRLSLSSTEGKGGKARLQGWAVVENQSGQDWRDVRLTLASGRPISFIEELSKPWYRPRQRIVDPLRLQGGAEREGEKQSRAQAERQLMRSAASLPRAKSARQFEAGAAAEMDSQPMLAQQPWELSLPDPAPEAIVASGEQAGETFIFKVDGVHLERGQGALLPIVNAAVDVERLTVFDTTLPGGGRSMRALRVSNGTAGTISPGPVALYDGDLYAGEARFDYLPVGADQLLSYALDLDVEVVKQGTPLQKRLESVKVVKGVLEVTHREKRLQRYSVRNRAKESRQVMMVQAREGGWQMVAPNSARESGRFWRIPVTAAAGSQQAIEVVEERVQGQQIALLQATEAVLSVWASEEGMDAGVRKSLEGLLQKRRQLAALESRLQGQQEELQRMQQEQVRVRENLHTVPNDSHFHARMLEKMDGLENRIEGLNGQMEQLRQEWEGGKELLEQELLQM
ncbi:DUF4139 domain-containing protein [Candidatus Magnetaquicoccus inordinatus]|uniref:DUF4139 domain-containing protein n=1 Tax=Candidatus Magnetaquicoccus inordinatus TaxID=2496818 RepID=UPI00102C0FDB|nr:DUF4139 domain-containing protein [Candidatus Magnetaquicoccus inordinatus]